jgi:hypothetical protein
MKSTLAIVLLLIPMTLAAEDGPGRAASAWKPKPAATRTARPARPAAVKPIPVNRRTVTMKSPFSVVRIWNQIKSAWRSEEGRKPAPVRRAREAERLVAASAQRPAPLLPGFVPVREGDPLPPEPSVTRLGSPQSSAPATPISVARGAATFDPDEIVLDGAAAAGEPRWVRPGGLDAAPARSLPKGEFVPATDFYPLRNDHDFDLQLALDQAGDKDSDFIYVDDPRHPETIQVLHRRGQTTWEVGKGQQVRVYLGAPRDGRKLRILDEDWAEAEVLRVDFGPPAP